LAVLSGHKLVRIAVSPREGGYVFLNSPDLPGFSLMLKPGDMESFDTMTAAVTGPLEAFIKSEYQACRATKSKDVRIMGMRHPDSSRIVAELCAA